MHRFRWPSYGTQLLGELQRQQNSAQFCDTLLQTEGISVPTHSCVLAALSPYLSQKLSVSPSPPCGHKRQLQLRTVNAQTLLKLVGLLYSGELVVKGSNEQVEVLAAAHQFGITDLVEGQNEEELQRAQEDATCQESSESGVDTQVLAKGGRWSEDGRTNGKTPDNEGNAEQPSLVNRDGILREDNYVEKRRAHTVGKSVDRMKQMMETAQISIKVKLRRRTTGEVWEVVNMQEQDETSTVKQKPEIQHHRAATAAFPGQLNHLNTTSDSLSSSSGSFTSNQSSDLSESAPQLQLQGSVEESDEQIQRLLEDIMMGLNILPSLERDGEKSQPSNDGAADICRIPGSEPHPNQSRLRTVCVFCQDVVTPSGHSTRDAGTHCCFAVQNQPSCMSLSAARPDALIQQQRSPWYDSSVNSLGQSDEMSCRSELLCTSQDALHPETSTTRSAVSSAVCSSGQELHRTAIQQSPSQGNEHVLEFLPQSHRSEAQSFCEPFIDDMRLPRCLSPLQSCTSTRKHQPPLNTSANPGKDIQQQQQQQQLLDGRPWLTENPGMLQFPLSTISYKEKKAESQPQELNATNGTTCEEMVNSVREMKTNSAAKLRSDPEMMKESLKHKHDDAKGGAVALRGMKRKRANIPQDADGSFLTYKHSKVSDGAKDSYSARLLSDSPDVPCRLSSNTQGVKRRNRRSWNPTADQTRIRTRGFVKKCEEAVENKIPASFSVAKPAVCRATLVNEQGAPPPRRKPGRPRKTKPEEKPADGVPAIMENKSVKRELQNEEEVNVRTKRRCRKLRRNQSEVKMNPLKDAVGAECTGKAEEDGSNHIRKLGTPTPRRMVSLKEFQKLIKQQHLKIRKYIESKERSEPGGGEESEAAKKTSAEEAKSRETEKDKNNNEMCNVSSGHESKTHGGDTNRAANEVTSLLISEDRPASSCDALGKGMVKPPVEERESLKNPNEGFWCGGSVSVSAVSSDSSHSDTHLFQENRTTSDQNLNPQSSEKTDLLLSEADGISKTSGCGQGQEEEEEEEVDVLLYSPDKVPLTTECEESVIMDVTPEEEEEEEDVDVIDVTEDDAE
ncbi:uncharacterized protein LOC125004267 isoform X2 [Mugil cephalus]|uniref:uncharacterized protein LOC125004267 isoform X2 n=1 Tax=Mugil cephalus TaxID=48193 RepID=UPI001FB6DA00|nr:uncharacterized protein LOC125004267 isoform X2 [Mugil cephalus]